MSDLMNAIRDGNLSRLQKILSKDNSVVHDIGDDMPPIMWACQFGSAEMTRLLLHAGAEPNSSNEEGETPLHIASFEGCEDCVRLLLRHGSLANARTKLGKTPLMNAAQRDRAVVVAELIAAGADPAAVD